MKAFRHVGLLLAAGAGTRFGGDYEGAKLDHAIDGVSIGVRTLETLATVCDAVIVVVREPTSRLACVARGRGAEIVVNPTPSRGLGFSMALGATFAIENFPSAQMLWVQLADLPFLKTDTLRRLASDERLLDTESQTRIFRLIYQGTALPGAESRSSARVGHPVVFGRAHWEALTRLDGELGAQPVIAANRSRLIEIETDDDGVWHDVDSITDLGER